METEKFSFINELLKETAKWAVPLIGAFIAVFFTPLLEHIQLRLNRADLRTKQFEEFATDLSNYIFHAELHHKFFSHDWTKPKDINPIIEGYNEAITVLRKKEFVYLSWAKKYWDKKYISKFEDVLAVIKEVDSAVHAFNNTRSTPELISNLAQKLNNLKELSKELLSLP